MLIHNYKLYLLTDIIMLRLYIQVACLQKKDNLNHSYVLYRSVRLDMNISFTKLGHEECKRCELFMKHNNEREKDPKQFTGMLLRVENVKSICITKLNMTKQGNSVKSLFQNTKQKDMG